MEKTEWTFWPTQHLNTSTMSKAELGSIPVVLHQNISAVGESPGTDSKISVLVFQRNIGFCTECVTEGKGIQFMC